MNQEIKRLNKGQYYWTVFVDRTHPILQKVMETNHAFDEERLRLGLYFTNKDDAQAYIASLRDARDESQRKAREMRLSREGRKRRRKPRRRQAD